MPTAGGDAAKAGSRYECVWTAYSMLELLTSDASSIFLEPFDAEGAEFVLRRKGLAEYHQVKRQQAGHAGWTVKQLIDVGVLTTFADHLRHRASRCVFVSTHSATNLQELTESARQITRRADFMARLTLNARLRSDFSILTRTWSADEDWVRRALRRIEVKTLSEPELRRWAEERASVVFRHPSTAVDVLAQVSLKRVHQRVTRRVLEGDLSRDASLGWRASGATVTDGTLNLVGSAGSVGALRLSALYELLMSALSRLSERQGWESRLVDYCRVHGVNLSDAEADRLIRWIRAGDVEALAPGVGAPDLVTLLDRDVMRTGDPTLAAQQARPSEWVTDNRARAEQLSAVIWGAVDAVLEEDERLGLRSSVAATHSSTVVDSLMIELEWLRSEVEQVPRLVLPRIPLERARLRLPPDIPASPYHLLWPRSGVVPFDDRGGWLPDLMAWCDSSERASVRIVQAVGGMGKTRLALEACCAMSRRGWLAGFYRPVVGSSVETLAQVPAPRLVVFDYAETRPALAREFIERLTDPLPLRANRIRVLLLVRRLGRRRDPRRWFTGPNSTATQLIDAATVVSLSTQPDDVTESAAVGLDIDARRRLFHVATAAFQRQLRITRPVSEPDLTSTVYSSPLFILIAGLLHSSPGDDGDPRSHASEDELLDRVVEREQHSHWKDSPEPDMTLQQRCVAVSTLLGADSEHEARTHLEALETVAPATSRHIALWLHRLYDGPRWLNPLEPDLLGEQLVAAHLRPDSIKYLLGLGPSPTTVQGYAVLARIAARRVELRDSIAAVVVDAMPSLLELASREAQRPVPNPAADVLAPVSALVEQLTFEPGRVQVPHRARPTIVGNRLAAVLAEQAVSHARDHAQHAPSRRALGDLAKSLSRSADWLADVGDMAVSVDRIAEAVEVRRRLAYDGVPAARAQLAEALNNLAHRARAIGRIKVAVDAIEEAVAIRRALALEDARPQDAELAIALTNSSIILGAVSRHDEALAAADEVLEIRRRIHREGDEASEVALATALNNRAMHRRDRGNIGDAMEDLDEAIRRLRPIADVNLARTEELAAALINKGLALTSLPSVERLEEAIEVTQEAVMLRRALADAKPAHYERQLADALTNLSVNVSRLARRTAGGHTEQLRDTVAYFPAPRGQASEPARSLFQRARLAIEESVDLMRELAAKDWVAHAIGLSRALVTAGLLAIDEDRPREALELLAGAVDIRRRLADVDEDAYADDLSSALMNFSLACSRQEPPDDTTSIEALEECIAIRRRLARRQPHVYRQRLSVALRSYSIALNRVDRPEDAASALREAERLLGTQ